MRRLVLLLVAGAISAPAWTAAQVPTSFIHTAFQWPDTAVQLADYHVVDQCLAVTDRVTQDVKHRGWTNPWQDTMPLDPHARLEPEAAQITHIAQACLAALSRGAVPSQDFQLRLRLDLQARQDSAAVELANARLKAIPARDVQARDSTIQIAFTEYRNAQPLRMALAERLLQQWPPEALGLRLEAVTELALASLNVGDTTRLRRYSERAMSLADSMKPADYDVLAQNLTMPVARVHGLVLGVGAILANAVLGTNAAALDTLRGSTAAYARFMQQNWPKALGNPPPHIRLMGRSAPPLLADVWMPGGAVNQPRPTPGRVSLVVFMHHDDCNGGSSIGMIQSGDPSVPPRCYQLAAVLHRMAARFPKLQFTTVAPTQGHFIYDLTDSAKDEAAQFDRQMAAFHWPGAWRMVTRPFWRLPDPDDRRIDKSFADNDNYSFGMPDLEPMGGANGKMYLVDQDGLVVYVGSAYDPRQDEKRLMDLIQVLEARGAENQSGKRTPKYRGDAVPGCHSLDK
ncbi:MAG: hypothetical protein ACYCVE_11395 [Gemmatimonadaceae bacterium]